MRMAI